MTHFFGAHTIDTGGIHMAVRRAGAAGMRAMQLFTTIPKYYGDKASIRPERIERFRTALATTEIDLRHVLVHAPYVLNTATHEEEKSSRARAGLAKELERSTALGVGAFCFHPGAALDEPATKSEQAIRDAAAERVAEAIVHALEHVPLSTTRVLVENTAGAGRTFAKTAAEVGAILQRVPASLRSRTGYGLDTCHLFSSGYDLRVSSDALRRIIDEFETAAGEPPGFFHLNDSEGELGSNRDRHTLIGEGRIGVEPFRWLVADPRSRGIPLILETPQQNGQIGEDDPSADPYDQRMMTLLASFES